MGMMSDSTVGSWNAISASLAAAHKLHVLAVDNLLIFLAYDPSRPVGIFNYEI